MATKRKSKPPKGYRDGGRVTEEPASTDALPQAPVSSVISETTAPIAAPAIDDAVKRAADAAARAEEYQRQMSQQMTVEQYIDAIPGISDRKRDLLRKYPLLLQPQNAQALARHHNAALAIGIEDDSQEWEAHILDGFAADLRAQRERLTPSDTMTPPAPIKEAAPASLKEDPALAPFTPPPMPSSMGLPHAGPSLPRGRTPAFSAPPSREAPNYSGKRPSETRSITLSPLEREIARNSFGAITGPRGEKIDLSNETKERMYAEQKQRLQALRASGEYRITSERDG